MLLRLIGAALAVLWSVTAQAQNQPVYATGALTPGHALVLQQAGTPGSSVTRDAGPAIAGNFTELGITNDGLPLCVRDKAGLHLLCLGANALGGGLISYNPLGNAPPLPLNFNVNGVTTLWPPGGGGGGVNTSVTVTSNAAMQGLTPVPATGSAIIRCGVKTPGDAPCLGFVVTAAPCSLDGGNGDGGSQVKLSNGNCATSQTTDPLQYGAAAGVWSFYNVTTTAGNPNVTLAGANIPASCANSCYITILGAGPYEERYIGQIVNVASGTQITVSPAPTLAMGAFSTIVYYGPGNAVPINAAIATGTRTAQPTILPAGIYMVEAPIQCTMFTYNNVGWAQPNCVGLSGAGAILVAVSNMGGSSPVGGTVFTVGGIEGPDPYAQYIRNGHFEGSGLTIDCNMIAAYGFGFPSGQDSNVGHFNVKNCLTANFHFGMPGSPQTTGGIHLHNNDVQRDIFNVPVTSLTCVNGQPNVVTGIDHGIPTGRVIAGNNINSMPGSVFGSGTEGPVVLEWQNTGARTGIIHGVNCNGWAAYTGGGFINLTPPSTAEVFHVTGMTAGNPTQITFVTGSINLANGDTWCLYGLGVSKNPFTFDKGVPDGCYQVSGVGVGGSDGPYQFTVPVDTTGTTYQGSGITFKQMPVGTVGVYQDNASDFEMSDNFITGVTYGTRVSPAGGGFDGKYKTNHFYNFAGHGFMIAAVSLGGHNAIIGNQCDPPVVFCNQFTSVGNTVTATEMNGSAFGYILDNASWLIRLETCSGPGCPGGWNGINNYYAEATSTGNKIFGQSSTLRVNELSNRGLAGNPAFYASIPNYHAFGNSCGFNSLYCMPDSAVGTDTVVAPNLAPTGTSSTSLVAMGLGPTCTFIPTYHTGGVFTMSGTIGNGTVGDGAYGAMFLFANNPPANGGSLNGSYTINGAGNGIFATPSGSERVPFAWTGSVPQTTLTPGTQYYLDAGLRAIGGGFASIQDLNCTLAEQ